MGDFDKLNYDPNSGTFTWKVNTGGRNAAAGSIAGCISKIGYVRIVVNGKTYYAHRIAWYKVYGNWPNGDIDHIDGIKNNNRIVNLREATKFENMQNRRLASNTKNRTSKFLGVSLVKKNGNYMASIKANGKQIYLGVFPTENLAHDAYLKAKRELHSTCII